MAELGLQSHERVVVFSLGEELYGVEIAAVREIITWQKATKIPRTAHYVEGILNLRGNVIPVVDLRKQFGLSETGVNVETRIMVTDINSLILGLVVDGVSEVVRIAAEQIDPPLAVISGIDTEFIRGVARLGERLVVLLDAARLLDVYRQKDHAAG